jgi:hypothetical protein
MKANSRVDHCDKSSLAEIQESIKELRPDQRATLCEWLNGYEGNALIFVNPSEYVLSGLGTSEELLRRD